MIRLVGQTMEEFSRRRAPCSSSSTLRPLVGVAGCMKKIWYHRWNKKQVDILFLDVNDLTAAIAKYDRFVIIMLAYGRKLGNCPIDHRL